MDKQTEMQTFPFEWDQILQNNTEYYNKIFRAYENEQTKMPWNWAAAIFGVYWLAYRKMTKRALVFLVAYIVVTALQIAIIANARFIPISVIFELGMFLYFGATGNMNYYIHVNRTIKDIKVWEEKNNFMIDWYSKLGGTSISIAAGFCLAMAAAEVIIVLLMFAVLF